MDSDLDFFKIITERVANRGRLQLPPGCRQRMRDLPENILLRDRFNHVWPVKITKVGAKWYFDKGWMKLHNDKSLQLLDTLLFTYKGGNVFEFKIVGANGCDKQEEELDCEDDEEEESSYREVVEEEKSFEEHALDDVEENGEEEKSFEEHDLDDVEENGEEEKDNDYSSENDESRDTDYVQEETNDSDEEHEDEAEAAERVNIAKKPANLNSKSNIHGASGSGFRSVTELGVGTIPPKRKYKKTKNPDCYGADIFRLGLLPRPQNPFFVSRSRPVRQPNKLYIPNDVINDYNLMIPAKFSLVDEKGHKWGAKINQWGDGRLACIGWGSLAKANCIERDDVCICEFVQGKDHKDFCIKVQHLRK